MSITDLRKEYQLASLTERDVSPDPFTQFAKWFQEALAAELPEPNAMTLATVAPASHNFERPSARIVLVKDYDARGFVFFTNYDSRKGQELASNPLASLLFHWVELERQVRIEGRVEKVSPEESDAYFVTRPVLSRVGAWASPQSRVIESREWLDDRFSEMAEKYGDVIPRPAHWGGYRLIADVIEFWQGRRSRLHDRILYRREAASAWKTERLAP